MKAAVRLAAEDDPVDWNTEWTDEDVAEFDEEVDLDRIEAALQAASATSTPPTQRAAAPARAAMTLKKSQPEQESKSQTKESPKTSHSTFTKSTAAAPFLEERHTSTSAYNPKSMALGRKDKGKEKEVVKDDEEVVAFDATEFLQTGDDRPVAALTRDYPQKATPVGARPSAAPIMPRIDFDVEAQSVSPSSQYASYLTLRRMSYTVKVITIVHLLSSMYFALLPSFWWMIFLAIAFTPLGFWAAHKYKARMMLIYAGHIAINILSASLLILVSLAGITPEQKIGLLELGLGFLFITFELYMVFYCYQFFKLLPKNMDFQTAFKQFFPSPYSRLGSIGGSDAV